jgi:2-polyprenyl-3-methyl-5-hydroxy-6-metoxy-1,4-benzoquinol methylase
MNLIAPLALRSTADERMDTDCVDYADYQRCLRDLGRVNTVTLTHRPMLAWLGRATAGLSGFSLLDVACGHGDALRRIRTWSARRGLSARLDGIDLNPWSTRAAGEATPPDAGIRFITGDVFAFAPEPGYDFIISSQFTHHLTDAQIVAFVRWMEAHAKRGWFIGDLHRHWFPYYGFGVLARIAMWHRFVRYDGRVSIARSFTHADWQRMLDAAGLSPGEAAIRWHVPFRLCVERRWDRS